MKDPLTLTMKLVEFLFFFSTIFPTEYTILHYQILLWSLHNVHITFTFHLLEIDQFNIDSFMCILNDENLAVCVSSGKKSDGTSLHVLNTVRNGRQSDHIAFSFKHVEFPSPG